MVRHEHDRHFSLRNRPFSGSAASETLFKLTNRGGKGVVKKSEHKTSPQVSEPIVHSSQKDVDDRLRRLKAKFRAGEFDRSKYDEKRKILLELTRQIQFMKFKKR